MKPTDRRGFLKTCGCIACFCGFGSVIKLAAKENIQGNNTASDETDKNERFALHWITQLLKSLERNNLTDSQKRNIIKTTSLAHHDLLKVPEMVNPYIGKPEEFIEFLQNAWGWIITDDKQSRKLIIDENKPFCVCPLLKNTSGELFPVMCYCSEGFAEKMFSLVFQRPVSVSVESSVQRGDPSCIYHIRY